MSRNRETENETTGGYRDDDLTGTRSGETSGTGGDETIRNAPSSGSDLGEDNTSDNQRSGEVY